MIRIRVWGLTLLLALPSLALGDELGDAYTSFEKGRFDEAAKGFQSHTRKEPQDYDQLYNSGVSLYRKGDYAEASTYFDRAKQSPDPSMKSRAAYNKGVAMGRLQRWDQAEAEFQEALSYDNDNAMIRDNLRQASELKKTQQEQQKSAKDGSQNQPQQGGESKDANQTAQESKGDKSSLDKNSSGDKSQSTTGDRPMAQKDANGKENGNPGQKDPNGNMAQNPNAHEKDPSGKEAMAQKDGQGSMLQKDEQGQALAPDKKAAKTDPKGDPIAADENSKMQLADPKGEGQGGGSGNGRILTIKDLKRQEAEKLLRSVDDHIGSYILTPEQANTEGKSRNGKDW